MTKAPFVLRHGRNPDVLSCIANLSNDEVFTPPDFANRMLDTLEKAWAAGNGGSSIWENSELTFLDPCTKTGVFLREITKRLIKGLEPQIPDLQERVDHILTKQVFGIAITDLTAMLARRSLYCSKHANGPHSIARNCFDTETGNIWFERTEHTWQAGKCIYCGASESTLAQSDERENHAYPFIHTDNIKERISALFGEDMQFDVVIGNPPYQLSDSGHGRSSSPIYQEFIMQAKNLSPGYLTMVVPSRWYAGGKGLDAFRKEMLSDDRIRFLIDFENSAEFFPGVDVAGGICYFLWDQYNTGECQVKNFANGEMYSEARALNEFPIFVRHSKAVPIVRKALAAQDDNLGSLAKVISSRKPFGLPTNYRPHSKGTPCWFTQKIGLKFAKENDIIDSNKFLNKWKFLVPPTPIAGQTDFSKPVRFYYEGNTRIARPGQCCTETWIIAFSSYSLDEVISFKSYLFTKIVRFLLLQAVVSQHVTKDKFIFIPNLGKYNKKFTDQMLCDMWGIEQEEWQLIDSKIKDISSSND